MSQRKITNKFNLPDTLVKAVQYDTHSMRGATISTTTLIDGAQIRYLKKLHDYEVDVADMLDALMGTAIHNILERANIDSVRERAFILTAETLIAKAEELKALYPDKAQQLQNGANWLFKLIPVFFPELQKKYMFERTMLLTLGDDHVLSGTFDLYDKETGILWDYKSCSVFMYLNPEARKKWVEQLNIYAYMLTQEGFVVTGIRVCALFKDWNTRGLMTNKDYPSSKVKEIVISLWQMDIVKGLIDYHISLHRQADMGYVPPCSGDIRWATADEYAIMTKDMAGKTAKRCLKKFSDMISAEAFIQEQKHKYSKMWVDVRPGESRRCVSYCPVNKFCPQFKAEQERLLALNS